MSTSHSDGGEHLAPVVPLFGGPVPEAPARADGASGTGPASDVAEGADDWHTTWQGAPVRRAADAITSDVETASAPGDAPGRETDEAEPEGSEASEADEIGRRAEQRLVRALGSRGLSEREARDRLRRDGVESEIAEDIVDRLLRVGAIDDDILAEQLVYQATNRKNQGRKAVAQSLAKRGLSRETIDRAIESLPDDDAERALEFARSKAGPLSRLDHDTALRRLVGQLSRRGFGGAMAMRVANQALDEARGGGIRRVRFQ
jgi:regulatory protein